MTTRIFHQHKRGTVINQSHRHKLPFCNTSSSNNTINPAINNCTHINIQLPIPKLRQSPYIPDATYKIASPSVIPNPIYFIIHVQQNWYTS